MELEMLLDEERENNRSLEGSMSDGERGLRSKVKNLEHSLEQMTNMYHSIDSQKTLLQLDNQVFVYPCSSLLILYKR